MKTTGSRKLGMAMLAGVLLLSGHSFAGRPLAVDDADTAEPGQFEFEAGAACEHAPDCSHWDYPFGLACGIVPGVEAGVGFGGQFEKRTETFDDLGGEDTRHEHGVGDLTLGAKWQFLKACPLGARHALAPSVKLPTADDSKHLGSGETDVDLLWIASRAINDKAGVHLNVGYAWIGGPDDDVLHGGVALDYLITDALQWVGEVFAERSLADGTATVTQWNTGIRWTVGESLTLDLAGGTKIGSDGPDYTGTAGLTWAFAPGGNNVD